MKKFAISVLLILMCGCNHTLPAQHRVRRLPPFEKLPGVEVCWLEYGRATAPAWAATAGDTDLESFELTESSLLIRHPRGDYLLDAGNSSKFKKESKEAGFFQRLYLRRLASAMKRTTTAPEAIRAAGGDPDKLRKIIISHAHFDHVGGIIDLPRRKVLMSREEEDFVNKRGTLKADFHVLPAHYRAIRRHGIERIQFDDGPYEIFEESADLTGDGSIVIVKIPGHTPGSIGTFINLSPFARMFHVGDTLSVVEGANRRRHKGWPLQPTDFDKEATAEQVGVLHQLTESSPEVVIIPAHDRAAYVNFFGKEPRCFSVK